MVKQAYHHGDLRVSLLKSAEAELIERGVEKFSLRGVAKRAGVSHAAPAHHFKDVAGILTALTAIGFTRFSDCLAKSERRRGKRKCSPMVRIGLEYIDFALNNRHLFFLMFSSSYPDFSNPDLDSASMNSFEILLESSGQSKAVHNAGDGKLNIEALAGWSTIHGVAELLLSGRMRSVLALSNRSRDAAIQRILESAIDSLD